MKKRSYLIGILILLSICLLGILNASTYEKTAVSKLNLLEGTYIICEPTLTTGYYWNIIRDEHGNAVQQACVITGADPERELCLNYGFMSVARNRYVFYVTKRNEYFSQELGEDVTEYVVSGWDILFPVRHENLIRNFIYPFGIVLQDKIDPQ